MNKWIIFLCIVGVCGAVLTEDEKQKQIQEFTDWFLTFDVGGKVCWTKEGRAHLCEDIDQHICWTVDGHGYLC